MYKQIIIVRKDLNMSPGKLASQVSHASMAFLTDIIRQHEVGEVFDSENGMKSKNLYRFESFDLEKGLYEEWINGIFTKVILGAKNRNQLMKAVKIANDIGMEENRDFWLIKDCCLTEIEPEEDGRTLTCIGFRPMDNEVIDQVSKKYQLY